MTAHAAVPLYFCHCVNILTEQGNSLEYTLKPYYNTQVREATARGISLLLHHFLCITMLQCYHVFTQYLL